LRYAFYPGCSLESTAWDFDRSTRAVCQALGIELCDVPGWICCGSTPAHATSDALAVALPVINLEKASRVESQVMTACAACYARLRTANHRVQSDPEERARAERIVGASYDGSTPVHHVLDVLTHHVTAGRIRALVRRPLRGLRVACYYGCLLSRPPEVVAFDDPEDPSCMEDLMRAIGAEPVSWPYRTECCGAGLGLTHPEVVSRLCHRILAMARSAGADCVAVACPMCQSNLDLRQRDAVRAHGPLPSTPVPYLTQLVGLAMGLAPHAVGLGALSVSAAPRLLSGEDHRG
jgi:heterodisulfide reductase subunit B2